MVAFRQLAASSTKNESVQYVQSVQFSVLFSKSFCLAIVWPKHLVVSLYIENSLVVWLF